LAKPVRLSLSCIIYYYTGMLHSFTSYESGKCQKINNVTERKQIKNNANQKNIALLLMNQVALLMNQVKLIKPNLSN
jgi:hypothetical protein